ncbi:toprim domain-containing protein [Pseudomonas aeruginosa]|uniref:toprim domain-containing protein n=1 Tax=Pseudomonas aeruginosa TaxID=287 RepID=UPI00123278CF|nr:toprim domain-containing protein [Pseudomonas aeruginosa]KAA5600191.1 bifunctional DNA primase/helicase [Pseudomonas aeruginosa]MBX5919677.1 toprim domain-containing protein [Pseudomonas aeruginosa]MCF3117268.1 toprim domain-containing protein [Pseudomonas aeruginosa]MCF3153382.1 toprim domain-containing protein [Pseudomonas aeruginosa]MCF3163273.1 toprim domain-containing protein [Pseudomonas aeruginosa]
MKEMDRELKADVLRRLQDQYGLTPIKGTKYMRKGECPTCGKKELYTLADSPWFIRCGRGKCGDTWHIKEIYPELFDDWSKRAPATDKEPAASARAYLAHARGFDLALIDGWYSQENYWDRDLEIGSATVRFPLKKGGYWERLIDRPSRFGKKKARFKPGDSPRGVWWCPPSVDLQVVKELWIVEGIFDAIALLHHGIDAVSAMSSNAFPEQSLRELATARGGKLPKLIWALDNEPGAHRYTRRWVTEARALGYVCEAAQLPQRNNRKFDWNDLHQRWMFIDDAAERAAKIEKDLKTARHEGALLIAESAAEKALLMYDWGKRGEFHFRFANRLYWFKLDIEKFNKAMQSLEDSDNHDDQLLNQKQMRDKALQQAGGVVEIANCFPQALYFQRNEVTDESWYYFRIDRPDDESVKNTFTSAQVAAASEFKKRLLGVAAGAIFTGSGAQLDQIMKLQLTGLKTVATIDYLGYSREHACYVLGDVAVRGGVIEKANAEDFFEFQKLRLKTLQRSIKLQIATDAKDYRPEWLDWLWTCFGAKGLVALAFWFGSLFAEQIRAEFQSFPFLEATGEAGAGKSTLITFLWKLLGRADEEGQDPSKMTKAGLRRWLTQLSNMPMVMLEADRSDNSRAGGAAKSFDWDEFKPLFNGRALGVTGQKTAGNETYEPPFRGTLVMSQNATVQASEAIMTRIVKLHFIRPEITRESQAAADNLNHLDVLEVSHFLLMAIRAEARVLECFRERLKVHSATLRGLKQIRIERLILNHAQMMALVDALRLVVPLSEHQLACAQQTLMTMALERQDAVNADAPEVAEFWEVYDYLENLSEEPVLNHSKNPGTIAINLNEFVKLAADHRQKVADAATLRDLLKESRRHKFIEYKAVDSAVRAAHARQNPFTNRPSTVKCWIFQA